MANFDIAYQPNTIKRRYKALDNYTLSKRSTSVRLPVEDDEIVWEMGSTERGAWLRQAIRSAINVCQDSHPINTAIATLEEGNIEAAIKILKEYKESIQLPTEKEAQAA